MGRSPFADTSTIACDRMVKSGKCHLGPKCGYSHLPDIVGSEKRRLAEKQRELDEKIAQNRRESGVPIFEPFQGAPLSGQTRQPTPFGARPSSPPLSFGAFASGMVPPTRVDAAKELFGVAAPSVSPSGTVLQSPWDAVRAKAAASSAAVYGRPPPLSKRFRLLPGRQKVAVSRGSVPCPENSPVNLYISAKPSSPISVLLLPYTRGGLLDVDTVGAKWLKKRGVCCMSRKINESRRMKTINYVLVFTAYNIYTLC
jgi:hypothetical protein